MKISLYTMNDLKLVLAIIQLVEKECNLVNKLKVEKLSEIRSIIEEVFEDKVEDMKIARGKTWYKGVEMPYFHMSFMLESSGLYILDILPESITALTNENIISARYMLEKLVRTLVEKYVA